VIVYFFIAMALLLMILSGVFFFVGSSTDEESKVFQRFREVTGYQMEEEDHDLDEELLEGSFYDRNIYPVLRNVAGMLEGDGESGRDKLEQQLTRAGRPGNLGPNEFVALQLVLGLLSIALVVLLALLIRPTSNRGLALAIGFAAIAGIGSYVVPKFYLSRLVTQRKTEIRQSLPFAIDLLVVTVEAGLGFEMALNRVVEKMEGALADEFRRVTEEITLGATRRQALQNMTDRVEVDQLKSFVSAIIQATEMGASIGQILRIQADQMRTERRQAIEEQAQKAPVKMLIPMVIFIFPTIFIVIGGPIGLKLWEQVQTAPI